MKPFSLCISCEKLQRLQKGREAIVTHKNTPRWKLFASKERKYVRFYEQKTSMSTVFTVKAINIVPLGRELVVRIEVDV